MKLLTMPDYFSEGLGWSGRREILLDICGDVDMEDVIISAPELTGFKQCLLIPGTSGQYYSVEEYLKIASVRKSDINKKLQSLPERIDEAARAMPGVHIDSTAAQTKIERLNEEREDLLKRKVDAMNTDSAAAQIRAQIANANTRLAEARSQHITASAALNEGTQSRLVAVRNKLGEVCMDISTTERRKADAERRSAELNSLRQQLLKEHTALAAIAWDEHQAVCPSCRRPLPEEQVSKMREDFNLDKSNRLLALNERGKREADKNMIKAADDEIDSLAAQLSELKNREIALSSPLTELQTQLKTPEPFESTTKYTQIIGEIRELQLSLTDADSIISTAAARIDAEMRLLEKQINELNGALFQARQADTQRKRIAEMEEQEQQLAAEYGELERGIHLCEIYVRTRMNMLSDRVNSKFKNVRFRLYIEQQNGGLKDDCEVMIPDQDGNMIPFSVANNAARINAGLEIIEAMSRHWGITMPVFVDNAESVTRLIEIDTQVIRLVVSEYDNELRLELDDMAKAVVA